MTSSMRVLVTGGAGYIGSITARRLADRGDEVVIDRPLDSWRRPCLRIAPP